jgi:hypothetical protein
MIESFLNSESVILKLGLDLLQLFLELGIASLQGGSHRRGL